MFGEAFRKLFLNYSVPATFLHILQGPGRVLATNEPITHTTRLKTVVKKYITGKTGDELLIAFLRLDLDVNCLMSLRLVSVVQLNDILH